MMVGQSPVSQYNAQVVRSWHAACLVLGMRREILSMQVHQVPQRQRYRKPFWRGAFTTDVVCIEAQASAYRLPRPHTPR